MAESPEQEELGLHGFGLDIHEDGYIQATDTFDAEDMSNHYPYDCSGAHCDAVAKSCRSSCCHHRLQIRLSELQEEVGKRKAGWAEAAKKIEFWTHCLEEEFGESVKYAHLKAMVTI